MDNERAKSNKMPLLMVKSTCGRSIEVNHNNSIASNLDQRFLKLLECIAVSDYKSYSK